MPSRQQNPRVTLGQGLDKEVCDPSFRYPFANLLNPLPRSLSPAGVPSFILLIIIIQVYQVVRKIVDEGSQYGGGSSRLTITTVYENIKRSNSSLNRKSKKLLIDSIERVLAVSKENDTSENEESFGEGDPMQQDALTVVPVGLRLMLGLTAPVPVVGFMC